MPVRNPRVDAVTEWSGFTLSSMAHSVTTGSVAIIVSVLSDDLKLGRICGGLWMARIHGQCGG